MHKVLALRYHFWVAIDTGDQNGGDPQGHQEKQRNEGTWGRTWEGGHGRNGRAANVWDSSILSLTTHIAH